MTTSFFLGARNMRIGRNSTFQCVEGDYHHNNYIGCPTCQEQEEDRVMPKQKRYREILEGDVFLRELTWSQEMEVAIREPQVKSEMPRNATVVTFEPKDKKDTNTTRLVSAGRDIYREEN
ncbi:hypothetical protein PM082_019714 [Marasmius tenuissimus]|nr:hypothetical protein PM082_019714 [Marasmius tenuissimus]